MSKNHASTVKKEKLGKQSWAKEKWVNSPLKNEVGLHYRSPRCEWFRCSIFNQRHVDNTWVIYDHMEGSKHDTPCILLLIY